MTGRSCWRAFALLLMPCSPALLHGQLRAELMPRVLDRAETQSAEKLHVPSLLDRLEPAPGTTALQQMVRSAGIIFSGRVSAVSAALPGQSGAATITFLVEHALRGTSSGETLTLRQWTVWNGERYSVGERALLFFYPPGSLGLTSLVGGSLGKFAVDPAGNVRMNSQGAALFELNPLLAGKTTVPYNDFVEALHLGGEK